MTQIIEKSLANTSSLKQDQTATIKPSLPSHLVRLPGEDWAFWRWICLRGAGFPHVLVRQLALPECASLADELLAAEKDVEAKRRELTDRIRGQMDCADPIARKQLASLLSKINKGKLPETLWGELESARLECVAAQRRFDEAQCLYRQAFEQGIAEVSRKITEIASESKFRQAVLLQNRKAVSSGLDALRDHASDAGGRSKKVRQREELVASYLQRYCVKNDSIGFFGPIGWVRFNEEQKDLRVTPGAGLVSTSNIYFEQWAIDALAEKLAEGGALRPWIAPRLLPDAHLTDSAVQPSNSAPIEISPAERQLLGLCTGRSTARQIASDLLSTQDSGFRSEADVFAALTKFVNLKIASWTFEIPVVLYPEEALRTALERIEPEDLRIPAIDALNQLETARDQVSRAIGNADLLESSIIEMENTFTRLTGKAFTRYDGEIYSGRTVIYQDCLRDLQMEVGSSVVSELSPALSLLLTSARWFTYTSAGLYRKAFDQIYQELSTAKRSDSIDLLSFFARVRPILFQKRNRMFEKVLPELQRRWAEILGTHGSSPVQYRSTDLRDRVNVVFEAPRSGWRLGRYHSPDVMIAASSIEDIQCGNYLFVLGEVHLAMNTVRPSFAMAQHPCPEEMFEAITSDLPEERIVPVPPKSFRKYAGRARSILTPPQDYLLEIKEDSLSWRDPSKTLPISAFVVEKSPQGLVARTRDGRLEFDLIEFFGELLSNEATEYMNILAPCPHQPRVVIDRLVIQRESWAVSASTLGFVLATDENQRFLGARRWRQELGLPRFVFVRVPVEMKPFYVDFESPLYVEIMARMVRRTLSFKDQLQNDLIDVVEMLPLNEQVWLPGPDGQKYTCELRIVALDLAGQAT